MQYWGNVITSASNIWLAEFLTPANPVLLLWHHSIVIYVAALSVFVHLRAIAGIGLKMDRKIEQLRCQNIQGRLDDCTAVQRSCALHSEYEFILQRAPTLYASAAPASSTAMCLLCINKAVAGP